MKLTLKLVSFASLALVACSPAWGQALEPGGDVSADFGAYRVITPDTKLVKLPGVVLVDPVTGLVASAGGGGGGGTEYTEDSVASANPVGPMTMCVRIDTPTVSEVSADGDNVAVKCDNKGRIRISVEDTLPVSGTITANIGTVGTLATNAAVDGVEGLLGTIDADTSILSAAVTSNKVQVDCITGCSGGTAYTEDAAAAADPVGLAIISRRRDTLSASEVSADGDNIGLVSNNKGQLHVIATATDALLTTEAGYVDGLEALIGTTNTNTSATNTSVGTVNTTLGTTNSTLSTISGKFSALGTQAIGSSLSVTPATSSTWAATQSGTWNVTNISGTVSLPTGAATAANQTTELGYIDGLEADTASIVTNTAGIATMNTALGVPSCSAYAGSGDMTLCSGIKGLYAAAVDTTAVATDITKINSVTPLMGNGVTGTGSQRVTVASDNTPFGIKIDQTTPGTTNLVAAYGFAGTATTVVTRPADTTAYAANDAMSDSTSAPTSGGFTLSSMCRASGGSGILTDLAIIYSTASAVAGDIWIYDASVTAQNDNAAWSVTDADQAKLVAKVPFVTVADALNAVHNVQNLNIGYTCSGTANLRFMVKVTTGYTPASADALTVRAKFVQTN